MFRNSTCPYFTDYNFLWPNSLCQRSVYWGVDQTYFGHLRHGWFWGCGWLFIDCDLEKAFDSIAHTFLLSVLEKFGFGQNFLNSVKLLLNKNESCVMNGGTTTKYFSLDRGARQGDPIAAYLFILVLEIFFILVRRNDSIHKLKILDFSFILSAYADDTTFFVADLNSIIEINQTFNLFSKYSGLKLNSTKCGNL